MVSNTYPLVSVCDLSGNECVLPRLDRDFLVITDDKTWVSSDGGLSWQEKSSVRNIQLGLVPVSSIDNGTVVSGSFTASRRLSSFYAQDIAYGNGKFLALGSASIQETINGSGTVNYYGPNPDNHTGNVFITKDNETNYVWGNQILFSSDSGSSWQYLDNQSFHNPRGIASEY